MFVTTTDFVPVQPRADCEMVAWRNLPRTARRVAFHVIMMAMPSVAH